jgi:hypothetical protein
LKRKVQSSGNGVVTEGRKYPVVTGIIEGKKFEFEE